MTLCTVVYLFIDLSLIDPNPFGYGAGDLSPFGYVHVRIIIY